MKTEIIALLLLVFFFCGCSIYGNYSSNPKSLGAFAGYEILLTKNKTFHISKWTDSYSVEVDSNGKRLWKDSKYQGHGNFSKNGDYLDLVFLNEDSISIEIFKNLESQGNSYKLSIIGETGKVFSPIVSLKDSSKQTVETVFKSNDLYTEFEISSSSDIAFIGFDFHMFMTKEILIHFEEVELGRNVFKFKTYNGYYPKGTEVSFYCKRAWSGIRYGPKKRWLAKKYKTKWINSFY